MILFTYYKEVFKRKKLCTLLRILSNKKKKLFVLFFIIIAIRKREKLRLAHYDNPFRFLIYTISLHF